MKLEFVRLLGVQRELYRVPRGRERFLKYLDAMLDPETGELRLPLSAMNPMADDHVPRFLDLLEAMRVEEVAERAAAETVAVLEAEPGDYKIGLVVVDDFGGRWTNRATTELAHFSEEFAMHERGWITGMLWTSETYGLPEIEEEIRVSIHRTAYAAKRGAAHTLREILLQEGHALRMAGARNPALEPGALVRTRETLAPLLDRSDPPTLVAALFGDPAARELGFPLLGLPARAGLALALHGRLEPRRRRTTREHQPSS
jgi:hypothetical protein